MCDSDRMKLLSSFSLQLQHLLCCVRAFLSCSLHFMIYITFQVHYRNRNELYPLCFFMQIDSWEIWNSFRLLCEHHSRLSIALDIQWVEQTWDIFFIRIWLNFRVTFKGFCARISFVILILFFIFLMARNSLPSANSLGRWFGESVRAALVNTDVNICWGVFYIIKVYFLLLVSLPWFVTVRLPICQSFLTNTRGYPCLSKRHQKLITECFNHSIQVFMKKLLRAFLCS